MDVLVGGEGFPSAENVAEGGGMGCRGSALCLPWATTRVRPYDTDTNWLIYKKMDPLFVSTFLTVVKSWFVV